MVGYSLARTPVLNPNTAIPANATSARTGPDTKPADRSGPESVASLLDRLKAASGRIMQSLNGGQDGTPNNSIDYQLMRVLVDRLPDYLYAKDTQSRFTFANQAIAADHGFARPEDMIGKTDFDLYAPELAKQFFADEQRLLSSGQSIVDQEEHVSDVRGAKKWLSSTKLPVRNSRNEIIGLVGVARDATARKREEFLSREQGRILELIATNIPLETVFENLVRLIESNFDGYRVAIMLMDADGRHLRSGTAPSLPSSYSRAVDGLAIGPEAGPCGVAAYRRAPVIAADLMQDPRWQRYRELAAQYGLRSCWSLPILSHDMAVLGTFALYSDAVREPDSIEVKFAGLAVRMAGIAIERRNSEQRIHHMAHHDSLTGLPNRALLMERLGFALPYARRHGSAIGLVFIDLDGFKLINDGLGHEAGDELLKAVARRLKGVVRESDTVARLGGDEFVVMLLDQPAHGEAIVRTLHRMRCSVAEPNVIHGQSLQVTCSIGMAAYPQDGTTAEELLRHADAALYRAKNLGRDNFQFYKAGLSSDDRARLSLLEALRGAAGRDEFVLHYQPQIALDSGRLRAVEALVRWQHPDMGLLSPDKFIPLAERTGLITGIGDWVLRTACRQNKAWQEAGAMPVVVSVNVSAQQFQQRDFVANVERALRDSGLDAACLELELTESLIMRDTEQAVATMRQLRALGLTLAIDDFGTGFSSLNALRTFPVTRLKIDRAFVADVPGSAGDEVVIKSVIALGHELGMRVVAEGIETGAQLAFLRASACDEAQGYYFSKPVAADEILKKLTAAAGEITVPA